jgi:hypothetical protein
MSGSENYWRMQEAVNPEKRANFPMRTDGDSFLPSPVPMAVWSNSRSKKRFRRFYQKLDSGIRNAALSFPLQIDEKGH